jgi:hypothetical protein
MHKFVLVAALGAAVGLPGCSSQPAPADPAPALKPVPIDGTYGGEMQLSRGDPVSCGNQNPISLVVRDHSFTYRLNQPQADWKPFIDFTATIGPDGTFNAQSGPDSMSGSVSQGSMQGQIIGDVCGFSFSADHGGTY